MILSVLAVVMVLNIGKREEVPVGKGNTYS